MNQANATLDGFAARLMKIGDRTLVTSIFVIVATALICYPYADNFSIGQQVAAHITMVVSAGALKLGYVLRLIGNRRIALNRG
ncbi:hypothetical protein ONV78_26995 [Hahella sp. CR1]|uniref:hypothetical protein n=1 Tax=Hahella sp. CR1 TaxID=2992807 RepID=UPI0024416D93|nr:hypothetical protein [Hahella sp. CR1]MDG9671410.1 hypothetical protein [Hahella sp. CR1]